MSAGEYLEPQWFVMRDLSRPNSLTPAWSALPEQGFEVFTPMHWRVVERKGKRLRENVPVIRDLLFVHSSRGQLDEAVANMSNLQYRYIKGAPYRMPLTVRHADMERFIRAVGATPNPHIFTPQEITPAMLGREVEIVGGPLDGYRGRLLSIRGLRVRKLLVELPGLLTAAVEVSPEFIKLTN